MAKIAIVLSPGVDRSQLSLGTKVRFVPDPGNQYDKNAIKVLAEPLFDDGDAIGFVCRTGGNPIGKFFDHGFTDVLSNTELLKLVRTLDGIEGRIVDGFAETNSQGKDMFAFVVEADLLTSDDGKKVYARSLTKHRGYGQVVKAFDEGKNPVVELRLERVGNTATVTVKVEGSDMVAGELFDQDENFQDTVDLFAGVDILKGYAYPAESKPAGAAGNFFMVSVEDGIRKSDVSMDILKAAVKAGKGTLDELKAKLAVMEDNLLSDKLIEAVFEAMAPVHDSATKKPEFPYQCDKELIRKGKMGEELIVNPLGAVLAYVITGQHLRLFGPPSSGKNVLLDTAYWVMNWDQIKVSGSNDMTKDDLNGGYRLIDGETKVVLSEYLAKIQEGQNEWPTAVVFDEANMIPPGVLAKWHPVMDQTRAINVEGYGDVKIAKNVQVALTMNEDLAGTVECNQATVSRTKGVQVFSNFDLNSVLKGAFSKQTIARTQKVVNAIESANQSAALGFTLALRAIIDALKIESLGLMDLKSCLVASTINQAQDAGQRAEISSIIEKVLG